MRKRKRNQVPGNRYSEYFFSSRKRAERERGFDRGSEREENKRGYRKEKLLTLDEVKRAIESVCIYHS